MRENRYEVLSRFVYHQDGNDLPGNESNPLLFRISSDYINIYRIAIRAIASMLHIAYFKTLFKYSISPYEVKSTCMGTTET